jgi:hypothetical protein
MARALLIGPTEQAAINAAIERARARPIAFETVKAQAIEHKDMVTLADRKKSIGDARPQSEHVLLPIGYRAAISFEYQPFGLVRHLSVSVDTPGRVPNQPAMEMIAKAFGFTLEGVGQTWLELVVTQEAGHG